MKHLLIYISILILCVSCNKSLDLTLSHEINITIDNYAIVRDLKDFDGGDLFPQGVIDDGSKVRVSTFIYDHNKDLVYSDIQIMGDFRQNVDIRTSLGTGEYILVAIADIVEEDMGQISFACWNIESTSKLSNLRIKDLGYSGYEYKTFGIIKHSLHLEEPVGIELNTQPVGSIIHLWFRNIDHQRIAYINYAFSKQNDYYLVDNNLPKINETMYSDDYYTESQYSGFYDTRFFLPMDQTIIWLTYSPEMELILSDGYVASLQKGVNKIIQVYVDSGEYYVDDVTSSSSKKTLKTGNSILKKKPASFSGNKSKPIHIEKLLQN